MRLTQKNEFFEYVLPCQNIVGDNQATKISLGETEYTCKKYIVGEAIKEFGELEDALEEFELTSAEDLRNHLNFQDNMAIWEGELNYKNKIADLEQELTELKQNAIVPKFKVGQEIYIVCDPNRIVSGWKIADYEYYKQQYIVKNKNGIDWLREDRIFATKEEAEQKLAEIGGKDE